MLATFPAKTQSNDEAYRHFVDSRAIILKGRANLRQQSWATSEIPPLKQVFKMLVLQSGLQTVDKQLQQKSQTKTALLGNSVQQRN